MYTKQEESKHRQAFWTTFGQYMQPVLSADGLRANWVNYKTGIPGITFRMDAGSKQATINILLSHTDEQVQQQHYDQFLSLRGVLHDTLGEAWQWQPLITNEYGKTISTISATLPSVNINRPEDWQALISFFKPRIIALDHFWHLVKDAF